MNLNNIFDKVKDIAGNAGEISKLVDMLPENIKSKVNPLIDKFLGGDTSAADKAKIKGADLILVFTHLTGNAVKDKKLWQAAYPAALAKEINHS